MTKEPRIVPPKLELEVTQPKKVGRKRHAERNGL